MAPAIRFARGPAAPLKLKPPVPAVGQWTRRPALAGGPALRPGYRDRPQ